MVTIKAIKDKKIIDLYSALGYDKKISKYKFEALDGATSSFFRGYVNQGNTISRSRVDLEAARLCALNFLHENDRGERFWPANSEGILEYAKDCDREEITDVLTHIFRKKNYSDYVQELKHVRRRKEEEGRQLEKPKCGKKRSKKRKHNEDDSLIATKEGPTLNEKACIASVLELDPPEHPSDVYCGNYIRGLNPQFDLKPAKEFRRKWLSSQSPKWPSSADCRLLRFMFDNGLFIAYDHGDEIPAASLRSFREGTEIEEMSGSEVVTFRNLVTGRVQELTHQLTQKPSLILTYRGDGVIHMTERFERFWGKKEVFWEESAQPPKKRKKSKAIRAKPPLALPNLQVQGDTMSETLPTDDDRDSNLQFASVAETALNLSAGWEALDEGPAEHSFLTKAMNINSEVELGITTSASSPRRNLSPEDSVVVAHPRASEAHVPDSMQILCHSQEKQNSNRQGSRSPTIEHTPCMNGSGRPTLLLKIPMIIPPMTEKSQQIMDESISPIHEICSSNRSVTTLNKCASPSESNESRRSAETASASMSLLNAPNTQQTTSTRNNDLSTACPFKWHAEFSWLDPQTSTNAQTTQLMETSTTHEILEPAASTSVDSRYASPYVPSSPKDREINFAGSQTSASSTPGSNRSSLVEVLSDSGSPPCSSTTPDILVKRKGFRPVGERSRPGPLNMATLERQSNNFLVEECLEEPWIREWTQGITCKPNNTTLNSTSQSSTFNSSLKSPLLTDFSWQRTEPSDKLVTKQDVTYQSTPQLGSDGVEALVASCPLRPIRKSPTWKEFTSRWCFERQSSSAISNFSQACEESPRVPTEGIGLPNLNKPAAVNDCIKEIDDSDQTEKTTSRQTSLKPQKTFDECTQSHRSIIEEVGCEEKKSQTSHGLSHDLTPPDVSSLGVIFPPVNTGRQSFDAQREPRVPLGIIPGDLTQRPENRMAMPVQEPPKPPAQETPQRRNGSYSFVPPPEAFTLGQPATTAPPYTRVPPPPVLSTDRRLSTTSPLSGPSTPKLTLLIVSADGSMSLDTTHSFDTVKNSTLSEFFQFYSSVSGTPLSTLTSLEFQPAFGKRQSIEIRRYGGEDKWKTLKEVITTLFDRAVRKDKEGRMEWQVLISCE